MSIPGLAVVLLPRHRHNISANCVVCRVRQDTQEKIMHVIDADDRRLHKKQKEDCDEIGGPTWRDDEDLKAWRYDDETNLWHENDDEPKSSESEEKEPKLRRKVKSDDGKVELRPSNNGDSQVSVNSDVHDISNTDQVEELQKNNELQLYSPENDVTYIEDTMGNNELDFYNVDSQGGISE